jgi:hypothetical protein
LGYPIFDSVVTASTPAQPEEVFYCKSSGIDAKGLYTPEGFVVLKGSIGRIANQPSIMGTSEERFRAKLFESGLLKEEGGKAVVQKDHLFGSPSMAAIAVLGRTANGWKEWKSADGTTLDELKRSNVEVTP